MPIDLTKIHKLEERYPFTEAELEILDRCHDHVRDCKDNDDFLMKLALASPYSFFFLPGDEMRKRVAWIEDYVLPQGFANELRAAISSDAFVEYANQGEERSLERFIEGVADTGRRGPKEALRVLYKLVDQPQPEEIADFCIRLTVASEALVAPTLSEYGVLSKLEAFEPAIKSLARSLSEYCKFEEPTLQMFVEWAESLFPLFSTPLSMFVHNLLFHGHEYPKSQLGYKPARLEHGSDIFSCQFRSPSLVSLSYTAPEMGGKWYRLFSSFFDGRSFNRMEWNVLGYSGPTVLLVQTTTDAVLGGFTVSEWKESKDFYGTSDSFLFQLKPAIKIYRPTCHTKDSDKFMYLHSEIGTCQSSLATPVTHGIPHGLGMGGTLSQPRLFIPESFEQCTAGVLDKTFEPGPLLPSENLERFEIKCIEVWGVGGSERIAKGLCDREKRRETTASLIEKGRIVNDKTAFAKDLKSGLVPSSKLFAHQECARGRQEFSVDNVHGGYKIE